MNWLLPRTGLGGFSPLPGQSRRRQSPAPDLVTGPTANTDAGIALVDKLSGLCAINILRAESRPALRRLLTETLPTF